MVMTTNNIFRYEGSEKKKYKHTHTNCGYMFRLSVTPSTKLLWNPTTTCTSMNSLCQWMKNETEYWTSLTFHFFMPSVLAFLKIKRNIRKKYELGSFLHIYEPTYMQMLTQPQISRHIIYRVQDGRGEKGNVGEVLLTQTEREIMAA